MNYPQTHYTATIARPSDFGAITRLCRRAVGRSDYVQRFLKEAIADRGLFLAWKGRELVGMTNFERCIDGSGWLSMARVDPAWRGQGVALFLQKRIESYAKQQGIGHLRLWALSSNRRSLNAIRKGGFVQICEAAHIYINLRKRKEGVHPRRVSRAQIGSMLRSRYISAMNGYLAYKWYFVEAKNTLPKLMRKGQIYRVGKSTFVLARTERVLHRVGFSMSLLDGPITEALRNSKETARKLGGHVVRAYVPYDPYLLRVAKKAGYKRVSWGPHCLVFELRIR